VIEYQIDTDCVIPAQAGIQAFQSLSRISSILIFRKGYIIFLMPVVGGYCWWFSVKIDTNFDKFVKSRIHHVFGVSCLVFGLTLQSLNRDVLLLNTKHQILNTLVNSLFFDLLQDCQYSISPFTTKSE